MPSLLENVFYDFSKLPAEKGILFFPISISKIRHRQSAQNCIDDLYTFYPSKMAKPLIGVNYVYSDFLYLHNNERAVVLKEGLMNQIIEHKNATQNIVKKSQIDFQIPHAFGFMSWGQLYLGSIDFNKKIGELRKIYNEDVTFKRYMQDDCLFSGREMTQEQIDFFLEEGLMFYLTTHGSIKLINEFIENQQKWVLICYPGRPLKTTAYIFQKNYFKLNWKENPYQNAFYDLEQKKLYEFDRLNLKTWNYE